MKPFATHRTYRTNLLCPNEIGQYNLSSARGVDALPGNSGLPLGEFMPIDWSPLIELVGKRQNFLLTTHIRPDGDGLGSMLALAEALRTRGKQVETVVASLIPTQYSFLDLEGSLQVFHEATEAQRQAEAIIVVDTGTWNQLGCFGKFMAESKADKLVIDHHLTQDDLGGPRLVDTSAEAAGRLIYEGVVALGGPVSPRIAHLLFVALAMDTGWFRHSNTRAATFNLAQTLMDAGARPDQIYQELYERNTLGRLRLMGCVLERLTTALEGKVAYTEVWSADYLSTGAVPSDTEDLVNFARSVAGVEVGLLFMEQPRGGIKVSFRARSKVDVSKVAEQFGGGGHRLASGAILEGTMEDAKRRVLAAVEAAFPVPGND
jgi:phosphoesterase RecJ-like protein